MRSSEESGAKTMFNYESQLVRRLTKFTDYVLLNSLFLLTSAPIVTIGVTLPAALTVIRKLAQEQQPAVVQTYWQALKANYKQGSVIGIGLVVSLALFVLNVAFVSPQPFINLLVNLGCIWLLALIVLIVFFILPYAARYQDSIKNMVKQSLLIARANFLYFVGEFAGVVIITVFAISSPLRLLGTIFFLTFGGSMLVLRVIYQLANKLFSKYE